MNPTASGTDSTLDSTLDGKGTPMRHHDESDRRRFEINRRDILRYGAGTAAVLAGLGRTGAAFAQGATPASGTPAPTTGFATADLQVSAPVTIEYWQYQLDTKVALVNELIPEFQAANPNITVKHVNFPYDDFRQQVSAAVQAGQGPDVLNVYYGWIPSYVQQQFLMALPPDVFPTDQIEQDFYPTVKTARLGDSYYALPTAVRTLALFCNNDLLGAAGVKPPTTWEEMVDVAKATVKMDGDKFVNVGFTWDIGGQGHNYWREALTRQNGLVPMSDDNKKLNWSADEGVEAFNYLCDFLTKYKVTQNGFQTDGPTAFQSGTAALHVDGSYRVGSLASAAPNLNYSIVPLPKHKEQASFSSFWANTITRNAAQGDKNIAAMKFIDFMSSESVQRRWTPRIGELPARVSLSNLPEFTNDPKLAPFIQSLPFSYATFMVNEADLRQAVMDAFDQVTLNGVDTKSAIQEAQDKVQQELDDYWSSVG